MVTRLIGEKKGWIRILEAVIAVLILASVLIYFTVKNQVEVQNKQALARIADLQSNILQDIASNSSLRKATLDKDYQVLNNFIDFNLDSSLDFRIGICDINSTICAPETVIETTADVFVDERIISSTLEEYNPKLLRLYVWRV